MKLTHAFAVALGIAMVANYSRSSAENSPPDSSSPGSGSPESPAPSPQSLAPTPSSDPVIESAESVVIPAGRPKWVEAQPNLTGDVQTVPVTAGPFKTHNECLKALDQALVAETNQYIADYLGSELAPTFVSYDARAIRQRLVKPENVYEETLIIPSPVGPMKQVHALLEFDRNFRDELDAKWTHFRATSRLTQLGLFSGAGLLLLASVFGYFRLDNATRGYYTGRLQFLTAAAILAVAGTGVVLARWITWL